MDRYYLDCAKACGRKSGLWKLAAVALFFAFIAAAAAAVALKIRSDSYRDVLIRESENFPNTPEQEEELAELRRRGWSRAHSPANRKSDAERLDDNRITVAE